MSWFGSLKCLPVRRRKAVRRLPRRGLTGFEVLETRAAPSGALLGGAAAATTAALLDSEEPSELQRPLKKRDSSRLLGLDFLWALENRIERLLDLLRNTLPQTDQAALLPSVQQVRDQLVQQQGFLRKLRQEKRNYVLRVGLKRQQGQLRLVFQAQFQQDSTRYKASFYWGAALAAAGQAAGSTAPGPGSNTQQAYSTGGSAPPGGGYSGYVDAVDDFFSVLHDTSYFDTVAWNDAPQGMTYKLVSDVTNGTLQLYPDGSFDYTPKANWVGSDSFVYEATNGTESDQATVTIEVTNSPPVAVDDTYQVLHDTTLSVTQDEGVIQRNDSDPDYYDYHRLEAKVLSGPSHAATFDFNPDGSFTYIPVPGHVGDDSFTYELTDGVATDTATVTIQITNSPPDAQDDTYQVDSATRFLAVSAPGVMGNDSDADMLDQWRLSVSLVQTTQKGTLNLNSDGSFTYTANGTWTGVDRFVYELTDGAATDQATVYLELDNSPPTADDDAYTTQANTPLVVQAPGVLEGDTDPDGDPLSAVEETQPLNGTLDLNPDGSFTYTPKFGWVGTDTFTYRASDGPRKSDPATVTIDVQGLTDLDLLHMAAVPECGCTCSAKITAGPGG